MNDLLNDLKTTYNLLNIKDKNKNIFYVVLSYEAETYTKKILDYFFSINLLIDFDVFDVYTEYKQFIKNLQEDINIDNVKESIRPYIIKNNFAIFSMLYVNKIDNSLIKKYVNKYCRIDKIDYKQFIILHLIDYNNSINQILYIKTLLKKLTRKASYFYINISVAKIHKNICNINIEQILKTILNYNNFFYITYIEEHYLYDMDEDYREVKYKELRMYCQTAEKIIIKKIIYNNLLYSFIINLIR